MTSKSKTKPYVISKQEVLKAWKRVRSNQGASGVDGESIEEFETNLSKRLYKLWNRMSSGSYFPKAVRRVEIPKGDGKSRLLGIPTVYDRVAQEVVRAQLEKKLEPIFHDDSYGYRPGKSALDAVEVCRRRNWESDWVLDVDIQSFFDTIPHELLLKAVRKHCDEKWQELYIERWLQAPVKHLDGSTEQRNMGTPQGGVISPLLANLFLHYTFDIWMQREHPSVKFERYADDVIIHCQSKSQSEEILKSLESRLSECGLKLHPDKTKITYCKDYKRKGKHREVSYSFVGFTFRPCGIKGKNGKLYSAFLPVVSQKAQKQLRSKVKAMKLRLHTYYSVEELAEKLNPTVRGWLNYFNIYRDGALRRMQFYLEGLLINWVMHKHRKSKRGAIHWLRTLRQRSPRQFAHWNIYSHTNSLTRRAV